MHLLFVNFSMSVRNQDGIKISDYEHPSAISLGAGTTVARHVGHKVSFSAAQT